MGECPTGALKIVERETEEFDEEAVERHLTEKEKQEPKEKTDMPCGCPSTTIQTFVPSESAQTAHIPAAVGAESESLLSHWPVQIRLIPAKAPSAGIKSITTVVMEVPCCAGLPGFVKKGLEASGQNIPMNEIVISTRGKVLQQQTKAVS